MDDVYSSVSNWRTGPFCHHMKIYHRLIVVKLFAIEILKNLSLYRSEQQFLKFSNKIGFTFWSANCIVTVWPFGICDGLAWTRVAPDGTVWTDWPDCPDWGKLAAPWLIIWNCCWPAPWIIWPWAFTSIGWFGITWNWGWRSWTCWGIITHCV